MANELFKTNIGEFVETTVTITQSELEEFVSDYFAGIGYKNVEVGVNKRDDDTIALFAFLPESSDAFIKNNANIPSYMVDKIEGVNKVNLTDKAVRDFFPLVYGRPRSEKNKDKRIHLHKVAGKPLMYFRLNIFVILEMAVAAGQNYNVRIVESQHIKTASGEHALVLAVSKRKRISGGKAKSNQDWKVRTMEDDARRRF